MRRKESLTRRKEASPCLKESSPRFPHLYLLCALLSPQRFRDHLRRAVDAIQMPVVLRRLQRRGLIHQVRPGRPYKEALYVRERPA